LAEVLITGSSDTRDKINEVLQQNWCLRDNFPFNSTRERSAGLAVAYVRLFVRINFFSPLGSALGHLGSILKCPSHDGSSCHIR